MRSVSSRHHAARRTSSAQKPLRVWWNTNGYNEFHPVESPGEAIEFLHRMGGAEVEEAGVSFNAGGMEEYDPDVYGHNEPWGEWYDEKTGDDISAITFGDEPYQKERRRELLRRRK